MNGAGLTPFLLRFFYAIGAMAFAALVWWLLVLNASEDSNAQHPYRPFTPQQAARKCAVEAGITANQPGQPISSGQMVIMTACMDREIAGNAGAK